MRAEYIKYSWFDSQSKEHRKDVFRCSGAYTFADGFLFANTDSNTVIIISTKARITGVLKSGTVRDDLSGYTLIPDFSNGNKARIEGKNGMIYTLERSNSLMTDIEFRLQRFCRRTQLPLCNSSLSK